MTDTKLSELIALMKQAGLDPMLCDCPVEFIDTAVCAGLPTEPGEHTRGEYIMLPRELVGMHPVFIIPVQGNSMKDADLTDGDQLKVEVREDVKDGDIVLASIDGACTVKVYFVDEDGDHWLVPRNTSYKPIRLTEESNVRFIGRVTDIIKAVQRTPYKFLSDCVRQAKGQRIKNPVEDCVFWLLGDIQKEVKHARQWYAVYRALVTKGAFEEGDYKGFVSMLSDSLEWEEGNCPSCSELRRMAVQSFRKPPHLWKETDAPVSGQRFDEYLRIARRTMELYDKYEYID